LEIHPQRWKVETAVYAQDTLYARGTVVLVVMPSTVQKND